MRKNKKKIISLLLVVIALLLILATYFGIKAITSNKMLSFLSEKYSASTSEFEIVDYSQGHYYFTIEDTGLPDPKFKWTNYKWQVKRNGRTFFVNYENKKFYDDYQLEDIEVWATKWLKDNIDEKIIGVGYSTRNIINHQKSLGTDGNMHLYTENNIYDFMNSKNTYENDNFSILYYSGSYKDIDEVELYRKKIKSVLNKKLSKGKLSLRSYSKEKKLKISVIKKREWKRSFLTETIDMF